MNEQSNNKHKTKYCQDAKTVTPPERPAESWEEYHAKIFQPGYQSPLISPDDSHFTPAENLNGFLGEVGEVSPAEPLGELVVKALWAIASIPEEIAYFTSAVEELTEAIRESNHPRGEDEPPQTTTEGSRPFKPPPTNRGGKYVHL